jgi:hypothetical protein
VATNIPDILDNMRKNLWNSVMKSSISDKIWHHPK